MSQGLTDDKSTLVQVMAWCRPVGNGSNGWIAVEYHLKSLGLYPQIQVMWHRNLVLIFRAKLNLGVQKPQNPIWPMGGHCWKSIGFCPQPQTTCIWNLKLQSKLQLCSGNHATYRVYKWKIQYGHQVAILKMTLLKMDKLLPIYISIVLLKFRIDIQS